MGKSKLFTLFYNDFVYLFTFIFLPIFYLTAQSHICIIRMLAVQKMYGKLYFDFL